MEEIDVILGGLDELTSTAGVSATMQQRIERGDPALALQVIERTADLSAQASWQLKSVRDAAWHLLLHTPNRDTVREFVPWVPADMAEYAASRIATAQPPDAVEVAMAEGSAELRAYLAQEMILRRQPTGWSDPGHPLGWLPATLRPIERKLNLPHYSWGSSPAPQPSAEPLERHGVAVTVLDVTTPLDAARFTAPVSRWSGGGGALPVVRVFLSEEPMTAENLAVTTERLGLPCLSGAQLSVAKPGDVWLRLFYAAGAFGALSRLHAWKCVGALAGAAPDATAADVEEAVASCDWYAFTGDWFVGDGWDLGIIAVRPDGLELALLAATDSR